MLSRRGAVNTSRRPSYTSTFTAWHLLEPVPLQRHCTQLPNRRRARLAEPARDVVKRRARQTLKGDVCVFEIIDLSQEIFTGMPVFPALPEGKVTVLRSREDWEGVTDSDVVSPAVNLLDLGEHTG